MSDPTTTELSQAALIEQLTQELAQLKARFEFGDTMRPSDIDREEKTGDFTLEKSIAVLENRVDQLEARESTRAHALQEIGDKLDALKELVEKYPAVDPVDIREIKTLLKNIPCLKGCEPDPDARPSLHSIRCAGE